MSKVDPMVLLALRVGDIGGFGVQSRLAQTCCIRRRETLHGGNLTSIYGIYGFIACVGLVYLSKLMRSWNGKNILMRDENSGTRSRYEYPCSNL